MLINASHSESIYANGFVFLFQISESIIFLFHTLYLVRAEAFIHVVLYSRYNPPRRQKPHGINETDGNDRRVRVETFRFYEIRDVGIGIYL